MADLFVSPVLEKIIDKCYEYLEDQFIWQTDMKEKFQSLRDNLLKIQAVLSVYSQVDIKNPHLNKWYWQLRDAIDEADDVLDDFEYRNLKEQVSENKTTENLVNFFRRAAKNDPDLKRLEEAVQKLSKISAEVTTFRDLLDLAKQEEHQQQLELYKKRETGSLIKSNLLGRSKEMESVRGWLRDPCEKQGTDTTDLYKNLSLLCVVGHGGMGKTTLLQHVYKDATLFDVKMWVCVSTNFDVKTVIINMLRSLKKQVSGEEPLDSLQMSLQSEVKSKKFLLVLDDIWEADEGKWEDVLAPLQNGNPGSKILITTRKDSVASKISIKNKEIFPLKGLEENECSSLFKIYAFSNKNSREPFLSIARDIGKKLSGCPLVAKIIGSSLKSKDVSYWRKVLNTDIGNLGQNGLMSTLKLSYTYLSKILQICFSFCSIFPEDHVFDKDDLVRMWISLGFIQLPNNSRETIEEMGRRYFDKLVEESFFDEFRNYRGEVCYKMHDLLHELAQFVSAQECFRIEDDLALSIPKTTRHLSINGISLEAASKKMGELKNLRSLFLSLPVGSELDRNAFYEILMASKRIRLLVIKSGTKYYMDMKIGCLIHLRYLKVERFALKLTRSISDLYHLQFISLWALDDSEMDNIGWEKLMPNENCQLILDYLDIKDPSATQLIMEPLRRISSFRYLRIRENDELVSFPTEIEQWILKHSSSLFQLEFEMLQSLQSLPSCLETFSSLNTLSVSNVPQLKLLPNPPGFLVTLELCYLESLQCLPSSLSAISSLETLQLSYIPLLKSLPDLPSSLKYLELEALQCLPPSLSTFSSLKNLTLKNLPLLKSLPDLPSSLISLDLQDLESLQCLPSSLSFISSLGDLTLINIPLLKSLQCQTSSLLTFPSSLKLLQLEAFQWLQSSFSAFSSLSILKLINFPLLESLSDLPSFLTILELENIPLLKSLPDLPSSSLKNLKLENIPLLKSLPGLPSSLMFIHLEELENLDCLPSCLPDCLEFLYIIKVPRLLELPELPSSLRDLNLEELENFDCLPSCLPDSLQFLHIMKVPRLLELPDLPASSLPPYIIDCHPQLEERYSMFF